MVTRARKPRAGLGLVEVLVAVAILALLGVALAGATRTGVQTSAMAGEVQLAAALAARVMDRLLSDGHASLVPLVGNDMLLPGDHIDMDGLEARAHLKAEELAPGLICLRLRLTWDRPGASAGGAGGTLALTRYVCDPLMELNRRVPAGAIP